MFDALKERAMQRLDADGADENAELRMLLQKINSMHPYFTTSSCAGRIALIELPRIGAKMEAKFLGKWHREITKEELGIALKKYRKGELWLIAQGPIIHVAARSLEDAVGLLKTALRCGFKKSGIISVSKSRVNVEILSTERIDIPIGAGGRVLCDDAMLDFFVEKADTAIEKSDSKLKRLIKEIDQQG